MTGLRLAVASLQGEPLVPLCCVVVPQFLIDQKVDGLTDKFVSFKGRFTDKLSDIKDLLDEEYNDSEPVS